MKTFDQTASTSTGNFSDVSLFFELSNDLFCIAGTDGYFKKVNPALINLLGYTETELLATPYINFVHPDDREKSFQESKKVFRGHDTAEFENRYKSKSGKYYWLSWSATAIVNEGVVYAVAKNITDKKKYEEQLKSSDEKITNILESITDGFYSIDNLGIIQYMNKASEIFTGKKRGEVLGCHIWQAFPEAVDTPFYHLINKAFQELRLICHEFYYDPLNQWVEITIYPSREGLSLYLRSVTERKENERKLKEAYDRYEMITEATSASIWEWEIGAPHSYWQGDVLKNYLGFENAFQNNGYKDWERIVHPDDLPVVLQRFEKITKSKDEYFVSEYRCKNKHGEYIHVRNRCKIIRNEEGEATRVVGVMDDITAEKTAEAALIQRKQEYRILFENAPLPLIIFDLQTTRILNVNSAAVGHYGYLAEEFKQLKLHDLIPEGECENLAKTLNDIRHNEEASHFMTAVHVTKTGLRINVELNSARVYYNGVHAGLITINDVTEKIRLQEELTHQKVLEQRKISQATFIALEKERSFIGKELHDNVNQILTGIKLCLEYGRDYEETRMGMMERSIRNIQDAIQEIRMLSKSLTSPILKDHSLEEALKEMMDPYLLCNKFNIHFVLEGPAETIHREIQNTVFRIVQEQLNNICKYAEAKNVWLRITVDRSHVRLTLKDDGRGFDLSAKRRGIGLMNIQSRVEHFSGKFELKSQPACGCSLEVLISKNIME